MKLPTLSFGSLSRFRAQHMALAMLIIVAFHLSVPRQSPLYGLYRTGNVGVDIFLLLSGIGLWFSWTKTPPAAGKGQFVRRWAAFYLRRLARIYPAWLVCACIVYIPRYSGGLHPEPLLHLAGNILLNINFWLHDELTFWYIPAIMMLYLFAPPYMELVRRIPSFRWLPALMILWTVCVEWVAPIDGSVGHIEIFWSRVPIFFIGINLGKRIKADEKLEPQALWMLLLAFGMSLATAVYMEQTIHGRYPLFVNRLVYIPLSVSGLLLLQIVWERMPARLNRAVAFIGGISLELYLIHLHIVMPPVKTLHLPLWGVYLTTLAISIPLSWALHWADSRVAKFINRKTPEFLK